MKHLVLLLLFLVASPLNLLVQAKPQALDAPEEFTEQIDEQFAEREKRDADPALDEEEEGTELAGREKRWVMAIPWALHGLRAAPALYRALVAAFSAAAVTDAGIEMARSRPQSRRVNCCRGYQRNFYHVHNCVNRGGGCCADDKTYIPSLGHVGLVNPTKVSKRDTSGICNQCYSTFGKCTVR